MQTLRTFALLAASVIAFSSCENMSGFSNLTMAQGAPLGDASVDGSHDGGTAETNEAGGDGGADSDVADSENDGSD
jgi:hypothetical protein